MNSDAYLDGFCGRCGRKRIECQKIIDTGIRCIDKGVAMTNPIAAKVARNKEKHPERYCPISKCLWRTDGGKCCQKHAHLQAQVDAINAPKVWVKQ